MLHRLANPGFAFVEALTLRVPGARLLDVRVGTARVPVPLQWEHVPYRLQIDGDTATVRFDRPDNWAHFGLELVCAEPATAEPLGALHLLPEVPESALRQRLAGCRIAFLGTARDCAARLPASIAKLTELGRLFGHAEVHVYENDSTDGTGELLDSLQRDRLLTAHREPGLHARMPLRTERLAHGRNRLLDHVLAHPPAAGPLDYIAWADLDGLVGERFSTEGFLSCFQHEAAWDAVFPLSWPLYYDIWALREDSICPGDYVRDGEHKLPALLHEAAPIHAATQQLAPGRVRGWLPVRSAFGGFGLYKAAIAGRGRYAGLLRGEEVCEHVTYHEALLRAGARLYLNPRCLTHIA